MSKSFAEAHGGLYRNCPSNFTFIVELGKDYGVDALVQYWYSMILASLPESKASVQCFVSHLIEFYESKLEDVALEVDQKLVVIKTVSDLTEKRLVLFGSPEMLKKAVDYTKSVKAKLGKLVEERSHWDFVYEVEKHAGTADKVKSRSVKKTIVESGPVV